MKTTTPTTPSVEIRYQFAPADKAPTVGAALAKLRRQWRVSRIHKTVCPDGVYCYVAIKSKLADDTGERADAVICQPE